MNNTTKLNTDWSTGDEMRFIDGLGAWCPLRVRQTNKHKRNRLKDYLRAIKLRSDWGSIDPVAVRTYAMTRLAEVTRLIEQFPHIQ